MKTEDSENQDNGIVKDSPTVPGTRKPKKKKYIIAAVCIVVVLAVIYFATADIRAYQSGKRAYNKNDFSRAETIFTNLGDYKDSSEWVTKSQYALAKEYYDNKEYQKAYDLLASLGDYEDSQAQLTQAQHMIDVQNDKEPPVITISDDKKEYDCFTGDTVTEENVADYVGATSSDDVSGDCKVSYDISAVDTTKEGTYVIKVSSSDEAGNTADVDVDCVVKARRIGDTVSTTTPNGDIEVTLDRAHWSGWVNADWPGEVPDGTDILLVEMTLKNISYSDEGNSGYFVYMNSGMNVLGSDGVVLSSESEYRDIDGIYEDFPNFPTGSTVRVFVPLFAPKETTEITLSLPNGATFKADVK